jgi:hypothetical protein
MSSGDNASEVAADDGGSSAFSFVNPGEGVYPLGGLRVIGFVSVECAFVFFRFFSFIFFTLQSFAVCKQNGFN